MNLQDSRPYLAYLPNNCQLSSCCLNKIQPEQLACRRF